MGGPKEDGAHKGFAERLRRRRDGHAVGSLFRSPFASSPSSATSPGTSPQSGKKSKRKSDADEITVAKRQTRSTPQPDDTVQSSPLSKELRNEQWEQSSHGDTSSFSVGASSAGSPYRTQDTNSSSAQTSLGLRVGYDTDPAQIVDMALRLSEGRRRQISGKRYVSAGNTGQRLDSIGNKDSVQDQMPQQMLGSFTERIPTSKPPTRTPVKNGLAPSTPNSIPYSLGTSEASTESAPEISKATLARVQKAKSYLELAHEHRRLLPHLPPIRQPHSTSAGDRDVPLNKAYNPLQYARNRKLRLREKSGLLAEADGWYDVAKVKAWVDAAINSHPSTEHDPTECIRLPPLSQQGTNTDTPQPPNSDTFQSNKQALRPRRPRSDWVTHPGDLLADAYWLEQGMNKAKILDRDNDPIYPAHTQFRYAGWRQQASLSGISDLLQEPTPPPEPIENDRPTQLISNAPELPKFKSTQRATKSSGLLRGPRKIKKAILGDAKDSTEKPLDLFESDSDSSTDASISLSEGDSQSERRGRPRNTSKYSEFDLPDGDPFSSSAASTRSWIEESGTSDRGEFRPVAPSRPRLPAEDNSLMQYLRKSRMQRNSIDDAVRTDQIAVQPSPLQTGGQSARNSNEYGMPSAASLTTQDVPSIAINLSPPHSRSPSPTKTRTLVKSKLSKLRHHSKDHLAIDPDESAVNGRPSHSRDPSVGLDRDREDSSNESRGNSPFDRNRRGSSPYDDSASWRGGQRLSTISRVSTKSNAPSFESHSRIKGMFKGGRIAELVGNEVSRVGDYIWKRDPPTKRPNSISGTSLRSHHSSDTENESKTNGQIYKTPPKDARRSISPDSEVEGHRRSLDKALSDKKPQYHNPNLPSFTSPFERDRDRQERKRQREDDAESSKREAADHISLQVAQHRSRSKSPRLDQLAPPRLDTSQSMGEHGQRTGLRVESQLDLSKSQSASVAYNNALGQKDRSSENGGERSDTDRIRSRHRSIANQPSAIISGMVSKKDVLRLKALLLMSSVKARSIVAAREKSNPNTINWSESKASNSIDNRLNQCSRHVQQARSLISEFSDCSKIFNEKLHMFSDTAVSKMHGHLQELEDKIENRLTPRARIAADKAGALSMKLSTTSTLAVKEANDIISEAFRFRKRGPLRLLRLFGFGAIEWAVVALLWFIWAVVTFMRLVIGIFTGSSRAVRWLFWID